MSDSLSVEITADGSPTIYSSRFEAHYHSTHGALQESRHVFIKEGLLHYLNYNDHQPIRILEYGLGTALNALLTLECATEHNLEIHYHGLEAYPVPAEIYLRLNYLEGTYHDNFLNIHQQRWGKQSIISPNMTLLKELVFFENFHGKCKYDIIYFDAFAPSCQSDLWKKEILSIAHSSLKNHGILVTFCAKGSFKRDLKSLGFEIERIPGPPGKREMTRATKVG